MCIRASVSGTEERRTVRKVSHLYFTKLHAAYRPVCAAEEKENIKDNNSVCLEAPSAAL